MHQKIRCIKSENKGINKNKNKTKKKISAQITSSSGKQN